MPNKNYRRRGNQKRSVFSRPRGQYRAPSRRGQMRTVPKRQNGSDVKLTVGRRLIWIYNNTDSEISIRPGEYIVLEIMSEYENNMGLNIRARPRAFSDSEGGDDVEFRPQDWV